MKGQLKQNHLPLFLLAGAMAGGLQADDTEIYLSTNTEVLDDSVQPNLMFVMDTSGSMGQNIAIEVPSDSDGFDYDPAVDYGASDDNLIYVYNTDYDYLGVTLPYEQSQCDTMESFFADNPGFPIFSDEALQWQSQTTTEIIEEVTVDCVDVPVGGGFSFSDSDQVDRREWIDYGPYAVDTGTEVSVTLTSSSRDDRVSLYVRFDQRPTTRSYDCRRRDLRNESDSCVLTAGNRDDEVWISVYGERDNADYEIEFTVGGGTEEVCTEIVTETEVNITEANWTEALETSDDAGWIMECRDDRGNHGADSAPSVDYVQNCGSNDCVAPSYTDRRWNEINWGGVDTRVFMSANYHDYVQQFGPPDSLDGSIPTGDPASTCRSEAEGYQFTHEGLIYECVEKMNLLKSSATELVASLSNMNLGLARLNGSTGGYVLNRIQDIDGTIDDGTPDPDPRVKSVYETTIDNLPASGSTPLAETLWEMMLYMSGNNIYYGDDSGSNTDPAAYTGSQYNTPMDNICQSNNVILLTDGEPTSDDGRDAAIRTLTGESCTSVSYATTGAGTCMDELAEYMATHDMSTGPSGLPGTQTINTYTIGFDIDLPLLETTAQKGQGQYFTVSNAFELRSAFTSIVVDILAESSTFVAPAISVNIFNQLQNRDEIYFAIFRPNNSPRWTGNVKKFRVASDGTIYDANGLPAIDPATGFFADSAQDLWSAIETGNDVDSGGFRDEMPDNRRVYTYIGSNPNEVNLSGDSGAHLLSTTNSLITKEMLGLTAAATESQRNNLILWGSGEDLFDEDGDGFTSDANRFVGDALHSRPFLVTYGGTAANPQDVLFVSTNMGYLHAIDGTTGEEMWSFIPQQFLDNIKAFQEGDTSEPKVYGLDGEISLWVQESVEDSDVDIEASDGDHVYLYLGMRRGGRDYFAFDASSYDPNNWDNINPVLKWQINGGSGPYVDLGQSWSRMTKAKVAWQCSGDTCGERDVLFFTGGYDTQYDTATTATTATTGTLGNAIYMIDADTGELLWSAGNNADGRIGRTHNLHIDEMHYSIPGSPNVVDVNADGLADLMFAVDINGNVFRFDLSPETTSASDLATGGAIYELNSNGDFRRFYNQPDIVLSRPREQAAYANLVFGSGYMSSPRDTSQDDSIFVLFEDDIFGPPLNEDDQVTYTLISYDEIYDARGASGAPADKNTNAPHGYRVPMGATGEKMLRPGLIFGDTVTYTSYLPQGNTNTDSCTGGQLGGSRLYRINLATGETELTIEETGTDEAGEPLDFIELVRPGIAPEGTVIFLEEGVVLCIATECSSTGDRRQVERVYWREEDADPPDL